ncbi:MAG: sensor histidine kinase, partial [Candidatus Limnocylindrales bacterium]
IANALRHAKAAHVWIEGSVSAAAVELSVLDDGVGIEPGRAYEALQDGHLGMASIRQRALAVGGTAEVAARPGGGTVVRVRWSS